MVDNINVDVTAQTAGFRELIAEVEATTKALSGLANNANATFSKTAKLGDSVVKVTSHINSNTGKLTTNVTKNTNSVNKNNNMWQNTFKTWLPLLFFGQSLRKTFGDLTGGLKDMYEKGFKANIQFSLFSAYMQTIGQVKIKILSELGKFFAEHPTFAKAVAVISEFASWVGTGLSTAATLFLASQGFAGLFGSTGLFGESGLAKKWIGKSFTTIINLVTNGLTGTSGLNTALSVVASLISKFGLPALLLTLTVAFAVAGKEYLDEMEKKVKSAEDAIDDLNFALGLTKPKKPDIKTGDIPGTIGGTTVILPTNIPIIPTATGAFTFDQTGNKVAIATAELTKDIKSNIQNIADGINQIAQQGVSKGVLIVGTKGVSTDINSLNNFNFTNNQYINGGNIISPYTNSTNITGNDSFSLAVQKGFSLNFS